MAMAMEMTDITALVEECIDNSEVLTEWESNFIGSIAEWIADGRTLSTRQIEVVTDISKRVQRRK